MTTFHEGQEVEVLLRAGPRDDLGGLKIVWRKAKIDRRLLRQEFWGVQFPDGSRAVFDADHIREVSP